ncbi:MAG: methyltransferase domain-containing protein [Desulfomonilaceae bacterium]
MAAPVGELNMFVCKDCGFVFNSTYDINKIGFGPRYDNVPDYSPVALDYQEKLIKYLLIERRIQNKKILEIGCGQAGFLKQLVVKPEYGNTGLGFDPSYRGEGNLFEGRLQIERSYFPKDDPTIQADVAMCRQVIEYASDPVSFLKDIKRALIDSSESRLFLETGCIDWILTNSAFCDIYYESGSRFSISSIERAANLAGLQLVSVDRVFGGKYLWFEMCIWRGQQTPVEDPRSLAEKASHFQENEKRMVQSLKNKIASIIPKKVAIWGASAKGTTLASLVDPSGELITCLVDINPNKQGCFIPVTGHPIARFSDLPQIGVTTAIVTNSNYFGEISNMLVSAGVEISLLDLEKCLEW